MSQFNNAALPMKIPAIVPISKKVFVDTAATGPKSECFVLPLGKQCIRRSACVLTMSKQCAEVLAGRQLTICILELHLRD
jgi:hypothetical protein